MAWIEDYRQKNERMPVFNPFETKAVWQPNISCVPAPPLPDLTSEIQLVSESLPLIIEPEKYTFQEIDKLAAEKAKKNGQPVAWA